MQYLQLVLKETRGVIDFCAHYTIWCLIACGAHGILIMAGEMKTQSSLEASTPCDLASNWSSAGVPVRNDELLDGHHRLMEESTPAHPRGKSFGGCLL